MLNSKLGHVFAWRSHACMKTTAIYGHRVVSCIRPHRLPHILDLHHRLPHRLDLNHRPPHRLDLHHRLANSWNLTWFLWIEGTRSTCVTTSDSSPVVFTARAARERTTGWLANLFHTMCTLYTFLFILSGFFFFFFFIEKHDSGNLYFCFRWLLICFKREFSFPDIMTLWEVRPCGTFFCILRTLLLIQITRKFS